ncbi:MAG: hypothetical protein OEW12_09840, partial [Deltaproteobacteria bacterium]|nr:hypothetical protein [Deltaproteobacteria bacterium]
GGNLGFLEVFLDNSGAGLIFLDEIPSNRANHAQSDQPVVKFIQRIKPKANNALRPDTFVAHRVGAPQTDRAFEGPVAK